MTDDQKKAEQLPRQTQTNEPKPPKNSLGKTILISSLVSILISGFSIYAYDTYFALKIVTVDFKKFIQTQQELTFTGAINKETMEKNIRTFSEKIKFAPKNTTILIKEVVVSDEKTLTN